VIAPWNFPLAISCGMCAAAIVAGNTVVYKPSRATPVVGHTLLQIFQAAGLPSGVFNYLPGRSRVMGDVLVEDPRINLIAFTGSMETGLHIIERAGRTLPAQRAVKKVIAEMGGKNAIIVDDDADLDEAVPAVMRSAFGYQGQNALPARASSWWTPSTPGSWSVSWTRPARCESGRPRTPPTSWVRSSIGRPRRRF